MPPGPTVDPTPLTPAQIRALVAAASRELSWGLHAVSRETRRWRELAATIPDRPLREDALHSLTHKRGHADGAALFTILPARRERGLLSLLVAYETIWDFLDTVSERHPTQRNGRQLHQALSDALDPDAPLTDYYHYHPWRRDGGYLVALITLCRNQVRALPSFERVRPRVSRETRRALVLGINHEPDAERRDAALRAWAAREYPDERELTWFELSGGASASLVVHALLTLAVKPSLTEAEIAAVYATHWPWLALATTMLDSYADQAEDAATGNHSYIAHYADADVAIARLRESIVRSLDAARSLRDGHRHAVIIACMIALYLSKDSARAQAFRPTTTTLAQEGGSLVRLLLPMLRLWRLFYAQRSA